MLKQIVCPKKVQDPGSSFKFLMDFTQSLLTMIYLIDEFILWVFIPNSFQVVSWKELCNLYLIMGKIEAEFS